ncbi:MAG: nucleoside deaminase [Sphingobacteriia bacterium]|jgi:tRNA(adenine34) deaminase
MLQQDEHFMQMAYRLAEEAYAAQEVPIGAVVAHGYRVLGKGYNQVERLQDPTAHAEMLALTAASQAVGGKYLPACTLYVTLEPCPMCAGALRWSQIGRIVYGAADDKYGYCRHSPSLLHPRTQVASGLLATECAALLRSFFQAKRAGL